MNAMDRMPAWCWLNHLACKTPRPTALTNRPHMEILNVNYYIGMRDGEPSTD